MDSETCNALVDALGELGVVASELVGVSAGPLVALLGLAGLGFFLGGVGLGVLLVKLFANVRVSDGR